MKLANRATIKVFSKPEDNKELILSTLRSLFPFSLEAEKIKIREDSAVSFNDRKVLIYEVALEKDRNINSFIKSLNKKLSAEQKELLIMQAESRLDSNLDFFIRLDKKKLIEEGVYWITDAGNCFHIKISIAAFPVAKEMALEVVSKMFGG